MTKRSDALDVQERFAVVFDICSSSTVIEELILAHNLQPMRNLVISMKRFLWEEAERLGFEVYKFIGDGWILLFDAGTSGEELIKFLERLSAHFRSKFDSSVAPMLGSKPAVTGLTFGIDKGPLVRLVMLQTNEYIGRALNVASRLQSSIKDKDKNPQYKVLISRNAYSELGIPKNFRRIRWVTRSLRNINGGQEREFVKVSLKV